MSEKKKAFVITKICQETKTVTAETFDPEKHGDLIRDRQRKVFEYEEREKCKLKKKYLDENTAASVSEHFNEKNPCTRRSSKKSRIYKCPWCTYWHLSTSRPK